MVSWISIVLPLVVLVAVATADSIDSSLVGKDVVDFKTGPVDDPVELQRGGGWNGHRGGGGGGNGWHGNRGGGWHGNRGGGWHGNQGGGGWHRGGGYNGNRG